jgi:hypothetical protein
MTDLIDTPSTGSVAWLRSRFLGLRCVSLLGAISLVAIACASPPAKVSPSNGEIDAVQAWRDFTNGLEEAGVEFLNDYPQPQSIDRAEGLRYMLQQIQSAALETLIRQPGEIPLLRNGPTTINKWGMDGADGKYMNVAIDSSGTYRFRGQLGTARLFAVQLATVIREYEAFDEITGDQIEMDSNGIFEILISRERPKDWGGNWLELDPGATDLIVREYFRDWETERPGTYWLERLDEVPPTQPVTANETAALLAETVDQFKHRVPQYEPRLEKIRRFLVNKVVTRTGNDDNGTLAANAYGSGWFDVGPDEALVIEVDPPSARMWSVQLGNVWWESIDYLTHMTSYNDHQARPSSDGLYRFVIAQRDPGVPNWLDPAGHREGMLFFRFQQSESPATPKVELVSLGELTDHLPDDTPTVTSAERRATLSKRQAHAARRWSP